MLKACLKLLLTGIIMIFVGVIGIGVLAGTGLFDPSSLSIDLGSNSTYSTYEILEENYDNNSYNYMAIGDEETDITSLDIDIGMGSFIIDKGAEFSISTDGIDKESFNYEIENGCLYIKYSPEFKFNLLSFDFTVFDNDSTIILTVPEKAFDSVSLNMTAGDITAQSINTKRLTTKCSAGSMYLDDVYAESANFKMTAGECIVSNCTLKNSALSMTAGDMYFSDCKLYGDNNIKMTAGELQMLLIGNRQDYKINVDKALGNVYIDGMDTNDEYSVDTTTVIINETVGNTKTESTGEVIIDGDGSLDGIEEEIIEKRSDNEKPNGSIDINMTAGDCYIEFLGGIDYE